MENSRKRWTGRKSFFSHHFLLQHPSICPSVRVSSIAMHIHTYTLRVRARWTYKLRGKRERTVGELYRKRRVGIYLSQLSPCMLRSLDQINNPRGFSCFAPAVDVAHTLTHIPYYMQSHMCITFVHTRTLRRQQMRIEECCCCCVFHVFCCPAGHM